MEATLAALDQTRNVVERIQADDPNPARKPDPEATRLCNRGAVVIYRTRPSQVTPPGLGGEPRKLRLE